MLRRAAIACLCPLILLVGCGNQRPNPPDLGKSVIPNGWRTLRLPQAGISLDVPRNWAVSSRSRQLVLAASSGLSLVEVWRYPRKEPLPTSESSLRRARDELVRKAQARDPRLQLIRSRLLKVDGAHAIELSVTETIAGQLRRDRSLHIFSDGAELVLEQYAPPNDFHTVDHAVFSPQKRSLRLFRAV